MRRLLALFILCIGAPLAAAEFDPALQGVRFFAYQLQNFDTPEGLQALADSHYDLLVIDQTRSIKGSEGYNSAADVARLHGTTGSSVKHKKVVCYLDPGQAEDFRWYWREGWGVGNPAWILASDPDWPGDYPVKFWDPEWKALMKQDLAMIVADGYDGAYLDWMEIYAFPPLVQAAQAEGRDPQEELIAFIRELRDYARSLKPDFFFIAQNAAELGACREWLALFSGIGQEDVWFTWGDGQPGDQPQDPDLTAAILSDLILWKAAGKVVFDIEYAQEPANVAAAYANGKAQGFITYATLKELDQLSTTPPPDYRVYNLSVGQWTISGGPAFSPDGKWIAFSAAGEGIIEIRSDGSEFKSLLHDPAYQYFTMAGTSWNAATDRLCFTSDRSGKQDIWSISSDGSGLMQLTNEPGNNQEATYSPDGHNIVFASDRSGAWEIYRKDLGTSQTLQLTVYSGNGRKPNWSPVADLIVFVSGYSSWPTVGMMDAEGTWSVPIGESLSTDPSFSPDGRWVAYIGSGDFDWNPALILTAPYGSYMGGVLFYQWGVGDPSFSPDGKSIAWVNGASETTDLWTMPIYLPPSPHERPVARP